MRQILSHMSQISGFARRAKSLTAKECIYILKTTAVTYACNVYNRQDRDRSMALADLQPAVEEGQRESGNLEKAPEIRNASLAKFRICIAEYTGESGAVRVVGHSNTWIQRRSVRAPDSGD